VALPQVYKSARAQSSDLSSAFLPERARPSFASHIEGAAPLPHAWLRRPRISRQVVATFTHSTYISGPSDILCHVSSTSLSPIRLQIRYHPPDVHARFARRAHHPSGRRRCKARPIGPPKTQAGAVFGANRPGRHDPGACGAPLRPAPAPLVELELSLLRPGGYSAYWGETEYRWVVSVSGGAEGWCVAARTGLAPAAHRQALPPHGRRACRHRHSPEMPSGFVTRLSHRSLPGTLGILQSMVPTAQREKTRWPFHTDNGASRFANGGRTSRSAPLEPVARAKTLPARLQAGPYLHHLHVPSPQENASARRSVRAQRPPT